MSETPGRTGERMGDGFCTCGNPGCSCICCGVIHCLHDGVLDRGGRPVAPSTPESFLAETLPEFARTQRIRALLAEVTAHEDHVLERMRQDGLLLNKARSLRERLAKSLETALSSTEKAQKAPGVGKDTPAFPSLQRAALGLYVYPLSKPGPY
jgi:hypothetical protein